MSFLFCFCDYDGSSFLSRSITSQYINLCYLILWYDVLAAVIFASNDRLDGVTLGLMLLGNLIAISMAILINNLNDKKQYPIYYAFVGKTTKSRIMTVLECLVPYLRLKRLEREERLDASARDSLMNVSMRMSMRKSIRR